MSSVSRPRRDSRLALRHRYDNNVCEQLERRLFLSKSLATQTRWPLLVDTSQPAIELAPETIDPVTGISPPSRVADPANIVWTNRANTTTGGAADTDGFGATFGTSAPLARAVVDAVIVRYEQMIGSFDYPTAGQSYNLTLNMSSTVGSGFGASASMSSLLGGKPKAGGITMGSGSNDGNANSDNGWFLDPTPFENSEFLGNIVNAFAGDAQSGSPAAGKGDFFTVVAAEMTHCMGLFNNNTGWNSHTTNTGIHDGVTGVGNFWVFQGASISHLGTSDNAGTGDFNGLIHSAEGPANIDFNGTNWRGAEDQGNAFYEFGRRYLVNNTFALMFKDAYGYLTVNPARFGTFYSVLNTSTGALTVRGGAGASSDNIQIFRGANNQLTVSVNIGDDIPGTGSLPGAGNLPSFDSIYNISEVSSIVINSGDGADVFLLDSISSTAVPASVTINAGAGNDSLITTFFGGSLDLLTGAITYNGDAGTDDVTLYDTAATFSDTYTITNSLVDRVVFGGLTYSGTESLAVRGEDGNNTFNINSTATGASYILDGGDGNDTFNVGGTVLNAVDVDGAISIVGGIGTDAINYNDSANTAAVTYNINNTTITRSGAAATTYDNTVESIQLLAGTAGDSINFATGNGSRPITAIGGGGNDTFNVTTAGYSGGGTQNPITLDAGAGADIFNYNPNAGALTAQFIDYVTGSGPEYHFSALETLNINGGSGDETYLIFQTPAGMTTNVNGGGGADQIALAGAFGSTFTLDDIDGPVNVNGAAGNDLLYLIDSAATLNQTLAVAATTVTRTGMANVGYSNCEGLSINAGSGGDTIDVNSTTATTPVSIFGGGGADNIGVRDNAAGSFVTVDGEAGLDNITVNTDSAGAAAVHFNTTQDLASLTIQAGGVATMEANGARVIETDALTIATNGKLDLTDNDMIVDYTSPSQLATIQALIRSARNGGAWNGATGITSSAAAANANHNTTLGIMEASEYKGLYGASATFDTRSIDTTAVLVKYTWYGDTDFNGHVNFDDYVRTDSGFNNHRSGWLNGDFDGNGQVNFDDYVLADLAFNTQSGTL